MSGSAVVFATGILVDSGLKATILLGLGGFATRMIRQGSAAQRHAVWTCTFAALPLLPLFAYPRGPTIGLDIPWLIAIWAVGWALCSLPILRALVALEGLRRQATADAIHADVRHSDHVRGPMTWGWIRPVIVFPRSAGTWSGAHRAAALAHERAHISRRDWVIHVAVWAVCALFWFHPLVWWARRQLAGEAEHATDDAVLDSGIRPSDYASLLVARAGAQALPAALGVGSSRVARRVRAVLDTRSRKPCRRPHWLSILVVGGLMSCGLGAWSVWSSPVSAVTCQPLDPS